MQYSKQRQINTPIPLGKEGLTDAIKMIKDAKIIDIAVRVHIAHPKAANLTIDLVCPDGTKVNLHKNAKNKGEFFSRSFEGGSLEAILGKKSKGNWQLLINDNGKNQGYLSNWSMHMTFAEPRTSEIIIPENEKANVNSKHLCHEAGKVKNIKASVNVAHSNIGQLKVSLIAPSGKEVTLHNKENDGKKRLKKTYKNVDLAKLNGENAKGIWTLQLKDTSGKLHGQIQSWKLDIVAN